MSAPELPGVHRREDPPTSRLLLVVVLLVGLFAVVGGVIVTVGAGDVEQQNQFVTEQRDAAATQGENLANQVLSACGRGEVVQSPTGVDLCQFAEQVKAEPVPGMPIPGPTGATGAPGRPPTIEEIERVVAAYMADHPPPSGEAGRPPTEAEVAAAVAQYLIANPPEPGRPPTAAEIADAVALYFADNPPPAGRDGQDGRPPTDEEIDAAVAEYLAANPPAPGPEGPRGPAGENAGPPASYTETYSDGSTKACTRVGGPDDAPTYTCGPVQPELTTTPSPTPGPTEGG
jgi:hypothetical protein